MSSKDKFQHLISLDIPPLQRLILLWINFECDDQVYCESSNDELSELLKRHMSNISEAITQLKKMAFINSSIFNGKRTLTLTENGYPIIIKNNNINNYSLLINQGFRF